MKQTAAAEASATAEGGEITRGRPVFGEAGKARNDARTAAVHVRRFRGGQKAV